MEWDCAESIAGLDAIRFGIGIKQITFTVETVALPVYTTRGRHWSWDRLEGQVWDSN